MAEATIIHVPPYRIEFDGSRNWTVTKRVKTKKTARTVNEEADQLIGYYGSLESSLKSVIREVEGEMGEISTTSKTAITTALDKVEQVRKSLVLECRKLSVSAIPVTKITNE